MLQKAHKLRRRVRKYPEHGLCFEFGKFYNARMPLMSGHATLVWTQGPLPTPPWGGWLTASHDALLPGLANPRHAVFAVLNAKYLSLYNAEHEAIACKLPAAAIPTDRILTAKLKRNMGYLTEVYRLRRSRPLGQVWCIEVVATHDDLGPIETPKVANSTNTTPSANSSRVEKALNIEDLPLCFPNQDLQLRWLRALQSIGRIDRKNLAPFSDSMANMLLRPE